MSTYRFTHGASLIAIFAVGVFLTGCPSPAPSAPEMVSVSAVTFTMGRTDGGDDALYGGLGANDELPRHQVTLSAYQIGKYAVTNGEYADILNWALAQGYLKNQGGAAYDVGDVYAENERVLFTTGSSCQITYTGSQFSSRVRAGLPGATLYSMALHPVEDVTWFGAAMYCNWLSESQGLTPCYDINNWTCNFSANGYHLPTEAQWERAAAWDTAANKHWIYGIMSDTLSGKTRCNYLTGGTDYVNPFGLEDYPYTSPEGWFDGVNVSPNGGVVTVDSPSPVGCYDVCGNAQQWCNDWYAAYTSAASTDPRGPSSGSVLRVLRGSGWGSARRYCRSACRYAILPMNISGFRIARS
jgi:formylglycine-generating enzyme required for sulfatase activity